MLMCGPKTYDESFSEILAIQSKVSSEVASALQTKLSAVEKKRIEKHPTLNTDAYQLYLKGRYYWNLRTRQGLDTSIRVFFKSNKIRSQLRPGLFRYCGCLYGFVR